MPTGKDSQSLSRYTITGNIEISPSVHVISFERKHDFIAGQVIKVALDEIIPPRIYSICSGNKEPEISVLFNVKKEGVLTPRLAVLIPGDTILASEPYGSFEGISGPAWWIAAGTGIAPFYSMLRSGLGTNKTLIHGAGKLNQFYFEDEFEEALAERYIRCSSKESSCNTFPGRVTDYLSQCDNLSDIPYFICGKSLMVVEVRDLLISKGIHFDKIIAEIYF